MKLIKIRHYCPCCGFQCLEAPAYRDLGSPPWYQHGPPPYCIKYGDPSYEVCPCCGFEFGFDDDPGTGVKAQSFEEYRNEWVSSGGQWFSPELKTSDWDLKKQLLGIGVSTCAANGTL